MDLEIKERLDKTIKKLNSRFIAQRFHHLQGFYFHETFSPIIKHVIIRVILSLALSKKWKPH